MEKLALYGGEKVKTTPFGTGKKFGEEELKELKEALEQNTLFYWFGKKVKQLTKDFAEMYGMKYCVATSSGTAAIHVALGALGIGPGDEVITTPVTDMGTVIGILSQNAIPVFADIDPHTYNLEPASIEQKITKYTKAILVVHLVGASADMDSIMNIAKKYNLKVIEDCAQSHLSEYKGKYVGTIGDIGCFSLNDFKQISTGEGGLVVTNDENLYTKASKFADKGYDRTSKNIHGSIDYLCLNYRMTELQGAVGIAQLKKARWICDRRNEIGTKITEGIKELKGIVIPRMIEKSKSTYMFYMFRIQPEILNTNTKKFSEALNAEGIPSGNGYIPRCIYENELFVSKKAYMTFKCPWECSAYKGKVEYKKGICPQAEQVLKTSITINMNEFYTNSDVDDIIKAIKKVTYYFLENGKK